MNTSTSHPTEEVLRAYGLGRLDDAPAASVHSHLEGCPECRRRVAEITSDSFLGRLRDAKAGNPSSGPAVSSTDGLSMLGTGPAPAAPPPASTLPPGLADLPNYEILRELGQGGMGTVFLARNTLMERMEVLKVVSGHLVNRRGVLDRFLGEIRNAARFLHPNIVAAYTALQLGESLVLSMEYVEGLDLSRLVKAKGPLPVAHACSYVHQAALGLQHAHDHGMVHRDIKPSNLMLAKQGNRGVVKVLDFGLAKVTSEGAVDGGLTHEGQMLGTPDYIAPEQISNARRADIRADIYSLGCTLYYLLTGQPPFRGDSLYDILQAHQSMDATPLNLVRPDVPVEVAAIVAKMMAKEPGRRFQEPKEVAQALKPFFKSGHPAVQGQEPEVSRAGQTGSGRPVPGLVSTPTQPATIDEGPVVRPKTPAEPSSPAAPWQSLIDLGETERTRDRRPALAPMRRRPWFWPSVAVGALFLGLLIAWGIVIRFKTADGTIELVNLPEDAEVFVDGNKFTVTSSGGGKPAVITVKPGKHTVRVEKDGFEVDGPEVTIKAGGSVQLTVRRIPLADSRATKADAGDRTARSDDANTPSKSADRAGTTPTRTSPPLRESNSNTHPTVAVDNRDGKANPAQPGANAPAPRPTNDVAQSPQGKAIIPGAERADPQPAEKPAGPAAVAAGPSGGLLPAGDSGRGAVWAYTTTKPGPKWADPDFDDSKWPRGPMDFGVPREGIVVQTPLKEGPVWLRARVKIPALASDQRLKIHERHVGGESGVKLFVDGRLAYAFGGRTGTYDDHPLGPAQMALLRPGEHVIAVRANQVDLGLGLAGRDEDGPFRPLFHGKDLTGWKGLPDSWHLEDGVLTGSPPAKNPKHTSTNLASRAKYRDFELRFQARLKDGIGYSGVPFRARLRDEALFGVVGYQCRIAGIRPFAATPGSIVSEPPGERSEAPGDLISQIYRNGEFNEFSIRCAGKRVTIMVNGFVVMHREFPGMPHEGIIAWQLHGGVPPREVTFKDVEIREIVGRPQGRVER
jgi:serine/threonine protein kinase